MPQTNDFEASSPVRSEAVEMQFLAQISQSASNAASVKTLFRDISRQLLSNQLADAVSLLIYDEDATRITDLFLITDSQNFEHTSFRDLPLGGLSLSGTEAAGLTVLAEPSIRTSPNTRDRLFKPGAPLRFFTGYRQQLHLPLIDKKQAIATLTLHARRPHAYSAHHLNPFVIIAGHVSMAIRLHAAREEKRRIEEERKRLLALGNALSEVSDEKELAAVMQDQFRTLFPSGDILICLADREEQTHSIFLFLPEEDRYSDHAAVTSASYPIDDGFYKQVLTSKNAGLYSMEELIRQKRVPAYIRYLFDSGICEIASVALRSGPRGFGCLFLLCDRHQRLTPGKTISMQAASIHLSMAIVNVLSAKKIPGHPPSISPNGPRSGSPGTPPLSGKMAGIIGSSPAMRQITQLITQVAFSESTILIMGETGTGKELVAKAIHEHSARSPKVMVKVNCAAIPASLIESELFGHEKGSFTDAIERKIGKFEMAHNGTLFLDEVGELPLDLQVKLLRVLQEKEIERIGGKEVIRTDVRIIAATNRCLRKEMEAGRFRSDLYYRLNVMPLLLPPLRERKEDIPALAAHFVAKHAAKAGKNINDLSATALQDLMGYHWPGNIRELEHLIERSVLLTQGRQITKIDLPSANGTDGINGLARTTGVTRTTNPTQITDPMRLTESSRLRTLDEVERDHILAILKKCNGKVAGPGGAADLLNIPSTTLNGKIRRLGIKRDFIA